MKCNCYKKAFLPVIELLEGDSDSDNEGGKK